VKKVTISELQAKTEVELYNLGYRRWNEEIMLIPLTEFEKIAEGETLVCIDGLEYQVGVDNIDLDTRAGLLAFGFEYVASLTSAV
jgi:hypothetical protein